MIGGNIDKKRRRVIPFDKVTAHLIKKWETGGRLDAEDVGEQVKKWSE